jgi:16S rRNA (adenine1518-N6/adenine1519-N6)-dimethyltransferase
MPNLLSEVKSTLKKRGFAARRSMGQNFMVDAEALGFIAAAISPEGGDVVIEIGPGLGFLTRLLLEKKCRVIAVEKDAGFARHLKENLSDFPLTLVEQDILKVRLSDLIGQTAPAVKVAGNIPYNITSPILEWMLAQRESISAAVMTVQKEVAERLIARPGTKSWGSLSLFVQVFTRPEILLKISKNSFFPSPAVDSAVVRFSVREEPLVPAPILENFFKWSRRAFQKRRKTLLNALEDRGEPGMDKNRLAEILKKAGIDPGRRAETLSIPEWVRLAYLL